MTPRMTFSPLFAVAAFALCGTMALAQQATAQPTPAAPEASAPAAPAASPTAAPIERQAPSDQGMQPGMHKGMRPGMMPGMRPEMMQGKDSGNFRGNVRGDFHGAQGGGVEGGFHIGPGGMWWKNPAVVQRLTLTPEQTKKMDSIFQQSRLHLIDLKANLEKQNALLEPLLSANPPDTVRALAQIDKVAQARAELEKTNARMLLGIRVVLTPEQWTKLHEGRGEGGFGGPGGPGANHFVAPAPQF